MTSPGEVVAAVRAYRDEITVLVLDPIWEVPWSYETERTMLAAAGARLVVPADADEADRILPDADIVIITGYRRLDAVAISSLRRAIGILCYSVGMDAVDLDAARAAGIVVRNVPDYCIDEVSDHALTLLLAAERRLLPMAAAAAGGEWVVHDRDDFKAIRRLRGQTLGIVGAGRIGRAVAQKARAFGFVTVACDPGLADTHDAELPLVPLETLLDTSDAIVVCAALTPESRGVIGREALARVRQGTILVNVARGGLIDEAALEDALDSGRIAVAALDVRSPEPPGDHDRLRRRDDVISTPHIAAASREAGDDLRRRAGEQVLAMLEERDRLP